MAAVPCPLRVPEEILALAKLRSKEEYVLGLIESGRISIGRASELLKTSVHDVQRLAEKHGTRLGATNEQQRRSTDTMRKLAR